MHGGTDPMTRHVEEVEDPCPRIQLLIPEGIASEACRRQEHPFSLHWPCGDRRRQQRPDVIRGPVEIAPLIDRPLHLTPAASLTTENVVADTQHATNR